MIAEIKRLTQCGLSDRQIGARLNRHPKSIAYHRKQNSIDSGRSHRAKLSRQRRGLTMNKRSYALVTAGGKAHAGKLRHGLNALAPLVCRGGNCPYQATCTVPDADRRVGAPCVTESDIVIYLTQGYCREFGVAADNSAVQAGVRHLVDIEIKRFRCNRLVAVNSAMVTITGDKDEQIHKRLNPLLKYDLLLLKEYGKVLGRLRAAMTG